MRRASVTPLVLTIVLALPSALQAALPTPADFQPDPKSVQRFEKGYRYPQAGWIVLHIEGQPYERGYQHGRLMASEIAAFTRCFAALQSPKAPAEGWKHTRSLVNALFLRRYDKEYLEEMKGIADGATAAGARFDGRPIDLVDIAALNAWPEFETLDSALEATATGLEGKRFPRNQPRAMPDPKPMHCSAFAATGPATADGKIVFGHITMFNLYPSLFYNVWIDIKPAKGHRVLMQTYPGGIQSGLDYYMNDAGLIVCETTIHQTRFDIQGTSLASRIRHALQYASSIDKAVDILKKDNNGLYTNEWLLADIKTNEIAMFELGTHKSKLYRSSKNEWFGGTEGFYWGCNNAKDLEVRLETVPSVTGRPANLVWRPSDRDQAWLKLFAQHKGKIDGDFGKLAFTTPPLAAYFSLDAKFTTTALAKDLKSWAIFGPPLGRSWQPTHEELRKYPEIRPMASNPWTVLHGNEPAKGKRLEVADLFDKVKDRSVKEQGDTEFGGLDLSVKEDDAIPTEAAWHGTILPKSDADVWLAAAFADYEKYVAVEHALRDRADDGQLTAADRDRLGLMLFGYRSGYLAAARAGQDVALVNTHSDTARDGWYRVAAGKGVLALHALRQTLGDAVFVDMMDSFGRANAGREVTTAHFQEHVEQAARKAGLNGAIPGLLAYWTKQPGLPKLRLGQVRTTTREGGHRVEGDIQVENPAPNLKVEITVASAKQEVRKLITLDAPRVAFTIDTTFTPERIVVDKHGQTPKQNGGVYSVFSFHSELEQTLIVYGTADEAASNREAAEALQKAIVTRWSNITVPIKSDKEVSDADLKGHHLLLIGRPDSNPLVDRFRASLPVTFGSRSFMVQRDSYAHAGSAVIAAAENPLNPRYSIVVIAGLSAESTLHAAPLLVRETRRHGDVLLLAHDAKPRAIVVPARELTLEIEAKEPRTK